MIQQTTSSNLRKEHAIIALRTHIAAPIGHLERDQMALVVNRERLGRRRLVDTIVAEKRTYICVVLQRYSDQRRRK